MAIISWIVFQRKAAIIVLALIGAFTALVGASLLLKQNEILREELSLQRERISKQLLQSEIVDRRILEKEIYSKNSGPGLRGRAFKETLKYLRDENISSHY